MLSVSIIECYPPIPGERDPESGEIPAPDPPVEGRHNDLTINHLQPDQAAGKASQQILYREFEGRTRRRSTLFNLPIAFLRDRMLGRRSGFLVTFASRPRETIGRATNPEDE